MERKKLCQCLSDLSSVLKKVRGQNLILLLNTLCIEPPIGTQGIPGFVCDH